MINQSLTFKVFLKTSLKICNITTKVSIVTKYNNTIVEQKEIIVFKLKQKQWSDPWVYKIEMVSFVGMALVNAYYTRFPQEGCHFVPNLPWTVYTN